MNNNEKEEKLYVSKRIQILIKNMFENRKSGWNKSKGTSQIQTKA